MKITNGKFLSTIFLSFLFFFTISVFADASNPAGYLPTGWHKDVLYAEFSMPPVIDGKINPVEWSKAKHYSLPAIVAFGPGSPDKSIVLEDYFYREKKNALGFFEVYLMYDDRYIYTAIIVHDTLPNPQPTYTQGREGTDRIEVYWDTGTPAGSRDYKMTVNSEDGIRLDSKGLFSDLYLTGNNVTCNGSAPFPVYDFSGQGMISDSSSAKMTFVNDHWEVEIKKAYRNPDITLADKSDININPATDILGLSIYWGNNDGECHGALSDVQRAAFPNACMKSTGTNGEYHAFYPEPASLLSYRYTPLIYSEPFGYLPNISNWADIDFLNAPNIPVVLSAIPNTTVNTCESFGYYPAETEIDGMNCTGVQTHGITCAICTIEALSVPTAQNNSQVPSPKTPRNILSIKPINDFIAMILNFIKNIRW